jgi:hypothetical protein
MNLQPRVISSFFRMLRDLNQRSENVSAVREYLRTIERLSDRSRSLNGETNLGLSRSIIDGVGMLVERYGRVIVFEDDLETSKYFLRFMNDALQFYESDERVISIHGYVYPVKGGLPASFFLKGADCWGWATWKRGWEQFEPDGRVTGRTIEAAK